MKIDLQHIIRFNLWFLLFLNPIVGFSQQKTAIQGLEGGQLIYEIAVLEDSLNQLEFEQVVRSNLFSKSIDPADFEPNASASYWLKISLQAHVEKEAYVLLNLGPWGMIEAWINGNLRDSTFETSGSLLPINQRTFEYYQPLIPITLKPATEYELIARLKGGMERFNPNQLTLQAETQKHFQNQNNVRLISQGLFFGIIIVMALYNAIIFLAVKDISYLYYILSIIGIGLYFTNYYGFSIEFLWPSSPLWDAHSFAFIVPLTGWARIQFTRHYLHTHQYLKLSDQFLKILFASFGLPMLIAVLSLWFQKDWLSASIYLVAVINFLVLTTMLVASYLIYQKGYKPAIFFLIANLLFVFGNMLFIFREINLLTDSFFTRYVVQFGVVAQVVLFSLGLANRLTRTQTELAQQKLDKERLKREKEVERKRLIEKQKEELEEEVANRTQDLKLKKEELEISIGKLQDSEQQLRELNELKDKLFSVIAHDLRSPLSTLDSFLNILTKHSHKLSQQQLDKLSIQTKQSLSNLSLLLDNLLQWAFAHMHSHQILLKEVNLNQVIEKNMDLVRLEAQQKSIQLRQDTVSEAVLQVDEDMLDFVLRNLLNNAIKFSHKNGTVSIKTQQDATNWLISVQDEGVGIAAEDLQKVLDQDTFFSSRGTQQEKGIGIGLSLCQAFIKQHGGMLWVESEKGKGATFHFTLPKEISLNP
ncbi:MAG: sensor histidine kinase [Flammeovirgaceae bacterium]